METKVTTVHVAGPWEVEYSDGTQRRVQRCLRCDTLIVQDPDRTGLKPAEGISPGAHVAVDDERWSVIDRELNPDTEEDCT